MRKGNKTRSLRYYFIVIGKVKTESNSILPFLIWPHAKRNVQTLWNKGVHASPPQRSIKRWYETSPTAYTFDTPLENLLCFQILFTYTSFSIQACRNLNSQFFAEACSAPPPLCKLNIQSGNIWQRKHKFGGNSIIKKFGADFLYCRVNCPPPPNADVVCYCYWPGIGKRLPLSNIYIYIKFPTISLRDVTRVVGRNWSFNHVTESICINYVQNFRL